MFIQEEPESFLNAKAFMAARGRLVSVVVPSTLSVKGECRTRCGWPSILLVTRNYYRYSRGRPVETPDGLVNVHCPECGYSMVGLNECRCPECGEHYTVDQLIRRQNYEDRSASKPALGNPN